MKLVLTTQPNDKRSDYLPVITAFLGSLW